ncbi:MAG: glycoside hydrolase [Agromyces sp.]
MRTSLHRRTRLRAIPTIATAFAVVASVAIAGTPASALRPAPITLTGAGILQVKLDEGVLTVDSNTLAISLERKHSRSVTVSAPTPTELGQPSSVQLSTDAASWDYPSGLRMTIEVPPSKSNAVVTIESETEQSLEWPVSGADESVESIQYANGSGQSIPVRDPFWNSPTSGLPDSSWALAGDLTLPAWGITGTSKNTGVAFYTTTDIGTDLAFTSTDGVLSASAAHSFDPDKATERFQLVVTPTDGSPIAAAQPFREHLQASGQFVSLDQKIAENPETARLIGAPHAYVWNNGRSPQMIADLKALGLERLWLGYDADGDVPGTEYVDAARAAGYLVAPYDTWDNAQDPATADAPTSAWPGTIWPDGCVTNADGTMKEGFWGRGCYVSTAALAEAQTNHNLLGDRVEDFTANGATSYFLDVDAAGQLFRDFSPAHPQTKAEDRARRLERLTDLSDGAYSGGQRLVLGSETAAAWANPAISYSHGSSLPTFNSLWATQNDRDTWGEWAPWNRPEFFFKPVQLDPDLATAMFDPAYRVPLYEAVLHDSVITTDRWEVGFFKLPDEKRDRALRAMLYNSPINYALDRQSLSENGAEIAKLSAFFAVLQDAAGTSALTSFEYVHGNQLVQRTKFDNDLTVTANFGTARVAGLNAGCVEAKGRGMKKQTLCL